MMKIAPFKQEELNLNPRFIIEYFLGNCYSIMLKVKTIWFLSGVVEHKCTTVLWKFDYVVGTYFNQ